MRLGAPESIPYLAGQERLTFSRVGITDPLSIADYEAHGGGRGLRAALQAEPGDLVEEISQSGLRGRGGAAFPAGIKWKTVLNARAEQKYIVCNADEGDSGTFSDRMILEETPSSSSKAWLLPDSPSVPPKATFICAPSIRTP